jgi:hypothetical protein
MGRKKKDTTTVKDLNDIPASEFQEAEAPERLKTDDLPAMTGPGVETPKVPALEKLIRKYEAEKSKRCEASPGELAAKKQLQFALHQHKASLPVNSEGFAFYRCQEYERDYILQEKMKAVRFADETDD